MSSAAMGAVVRYCGHRGTFIADIRSIGNVNVVHASAPVLMDTLNRDAGDYAYATHHIVDFPEGGFWRPNIGVFVVPETQVTELCRRHPK